MCALNLGYNRLMRLVLAVFAMLAASLAYAQQEPVYVVTHIDLLPTRANILKFLREYLKGMRPTDSIVVAFAGHGVQFIDGQVKVVTVLGVPLNPLKRNVKRCSGRAKSDGRPTTFRK